MERLNEKEEPLLKILGQVKIQIKLNKIVVNGRQIVWKAMNFPVFSHFQAEKSIYKMRK